MEVGGNPGVELVMEFLKKNGLEEVERALEEDLMEKDRVDSVSSFDYEKFVFPMVPAPPPVKILSSYRRSSGIEMRSGDSSRSDEDEFVSLGSSSSEFINPYGVESQSATGVCSEVSSDEMSAFGTARDYHDFEMQDEVYWYGDKDGGGFITPRFSGLEQEPFGCPTQDKFVMTFETAKQCEKPGVLGHELDTSSIDYLHKPSDDVDGLQLADDFQFTEKMQFEKDNQWELQKFSAQDFTPLCKCCVGTGGPYNQDPEDYVELQMKECERNDNEFKAAGEIPSNAYAEVHPKTSKKNDSCTKDNLRNTLLGDFNSIPDLGIRVSAKDLQQIEKYGHKSIDTMDHDGESHKLDFTGVKEHGTTADELLFFDNYEDEYEVFSLRIIHRKNRTGFEENKDFPIVLNTVIAGRYYVTEYLGSAAFSKVVQAQDLLAGIDVCLKIIKNDKDFFDQSLDEIKLLKLVNKQDPADERHILRLYDYFYHQEHLFIVCELLRANLYEFQKFNQESGGEPYFTMKRLQIITRQCLEALEFLHQMGIIHCDLKPENILIKSYSRCEIKVIDLGSSCFLEDNLSLYVQSRSYRAPEVILGLSYDEKIDIWSLGCILAELCSGEVLFPNETLAMLLGRVIGMLGPIGMDMLEKGQETSKYFTEEYDLYYINEETNQPEYVIPEELSLEQHLPVSDVGFVDFVTCLLEINPRMRPTAKEALQHPWLSQRYDP